MLSEAWDRLGKEEDSANTEPDEIIVFVDSQGEGNRIEPSVQGFKVRQIVTRPFTVPNAMGQSCKLLYRN
jgi:hypothetical protein